MSVVALSSPRDTPTISSLLLGVPYLFIEYGAHLRACGHFDHPLCPWVLPRRSIRPLGRITLIQSGGGRLWRRA